MNPAAPRLTDYIHVPPHGETDSLSAPFIKCYELKFVSPRNSNVETLIPNVIVFGGGGLRR